MKKCLSLLAVAISLGAYALEPVAFHKSFVAPALPQLTVLKTINKPNGHIVQIVRDEKGHVFKVRPQAETGRASFRSYAKPSCSRAAAAAERTYYEGFEGYDSSFGLNWIPEGWSKINTEAHTPTEEQLSHNINNSWYVYYSSDFYQEKTSDGECEAFIHFGYEGNYGCNSKAQDEWLVSPEITLGDNETLSFLLQFDAFSIYPWDWNAWCVADRNAVENTMKVMLTKDDGESWECIWDLEADHVRSMTDEEIDNALMSYHDFSVSLAPYAGEKVKIAFRYIRIEGDYIGNSMMVDRVVVDHPAGPWALLGTGTMADGWVIPALTKNPGEYYDPSDYVFNVDIYESTEKAGVYKIASPYTSAAFPFIDLNANKEQPYDIVIDASNPDFVVVEPQISGFEHSDPGSKAARYAVPYYISNAGKYYFDEGNEISDIIDFGYASTFDAESGVITITKPQYGHEVGGKLDMGYSCSDMEGYPTVVTLPSKAPEQAWTSLGKATFVDGFLYSGYFGNPKGHGWEVEIQEKNDNPGLYRMVNPYTTENCPMEYFNESSADTYVTIDATNPDMVVVQPQYSGFSGSINNEFWDFYIGNLAGIYIAYGYTPSYIENVLEEDEKDALADGVITFNTPLFGSDNGDGFGYNWIDAAGFPLLYKAKLYLPSATETPEEADIEASKLELDIHEVEGAVGGTLALTATVYPDNTTVKTVNWGSSNEEVATVSEAGVVTFVAEGTAEIIACCGMAYDSCIISVEASSGINSVIYESDSEATYYTPLGIKVNGTPTHGIYIKVSGGKASKVIL